MLRVVRWTIGLLVVGAVVGWLGWIVTERIAAAMEEETEGSRDRSVAVEIAEVERGHIRDVRRFTGTLRARSRVEIAPRISGELIHLAVDIGDIVERGQVIARLDDEEFRQEVEQARADLLVAEANLAERRSALEIAEREFERTQQLREQRIASDSELDAARSQYFASQAALQVAKAERTRREASLRASQVRLSYTEIVAKWETGGPARVVGERYIDEGSMIGANEPIISLLDLDELIALVYVTERDYTPMRIGMEASVVADARPTDNHNGRIVRMSPAFQEGSRQARIEVNVDNPEHTLKPGMFVRVGIEVGEADDAAIIPRQALIQRDGEQGVFIVDQDSMTAQFVPVRIGIRDRERVQIIEPDLHGPVVTLGQHLLSDGAAVIIAEGEG